MNVIFSFVFFLCANNHWSSPVIINWLENQVQYLSSDTRSFLREFIPCHRKYSQSEYGKAVVYSMVLHPTLQSFAQCWSRNVDHCVFYGMVWNRYATFSRDLLKVAPYSFWTARELISKISRWRELSISTLKSRAESRSKMPTNMASKYLKFVYR